MAAILVSGHMSSSIRHASGSPQRLQSRRGSHAPARQSVLDAVIVGGGPAGLSTALVLGRARRRVLVLDTERPANAVSQGGIGGLLAQTRVAPTDLRKAGREQLSEYPTVEVRKGAALAAEPLGDAFRIALDDGGSVRARALILAHGLRYDPPPLPGIEPLWGSSVFHCPFCDGWEVRDLRLAFHGNGPEAARSALFASGWSSDVVLCTDGPARLEGERAALEAAGVRIREEPVRELVGQGGWLDRIEFMSGPAEHRDALFVRTTRDQPNDLAAALGCRLSAGGTIETDADGRTSVPGVYAAGDAATEYSRSVANAIGTGSRVAYAVAVELATR
jgi:thioredoxin reductase